MSSPHEAVPEERPEQPAQPAEDGKAADEAEKGQAEPESAEVVKDAPADEEDKLSDMEIEDHEDGHEHHQSWTNSVTKYVRADGKPIRWIYDRCNGHERVMNPHSKPPCFLMFPNGFLKLFPGIFESNPFMEWFGRVGCVKPEWVWARHAIFGVAMITSTVGWVCILLADFAISKDFDILNKLDFSNAHVEFTFAGENFATISEGTTDINVGLTAVAWTKQTFNITLEQLFALDDEVFNDDKWAEPFTTREEIVTSFSAFCDGEDRVWFVEPDQCDACRKVSNKMVRSILMATVFYFFTFKNDWLRFWVNYDVNCQKFMSVFVACITCGLALNTFFRYRNECFASFREGVNCFYINGTTTECPLVYTSEDDEELTLADFNEATRISFADIDWDVGPGFILLGSAVFIRVFSMLCNLAVPTPSITRNHDQQWEYERIAREQDKDEEAAKARKSEYFAPW